MVSQQNARSRGLCFRPSRLELQSMFRVGRLAEVCILLDSILTILASTLLGAGAGYFVSKKQDTDRAKKRREAVAAALLADLQRIRQELGPPHDEIVELRFYGSHPLPPSIHEWTKGLIPELADFDADLVLEFFRLERALHNYAVTLKAYRSTLDALTERTDRREGLSHELEAPGNHDGDPSWVDRLNEAAALDREITALGDQNQLWHDSAVDERKRAVSIMERIDTRLLTVLPSERQVELLPARSGEGATDSVR